MKRNTICLYIDISEWTSVL